MTTVADLLPWLSLLLPIMLPMLVALNAKLAHIEARMAAQAEQLQTLRNAPERLATLAAVQAEHARRLESWRPGTPTTHPTT